MLRRLAAATTVLAAIALPGTPGSARQQQPQPQFRAGVTLVGVDVTVLDRDGRPVTGLSVADFEITLDGKPQPVRTLSYVQVSEPRAADAAGPAADPADGGHVVVTNAVPGDERKTFILAIDDLSFPAEEGRRMMTAARTFVESRPAHEFVGLTTTSGAVAVNPTLDRSAIAAGLRRVVGTFIDPRRSAAGEAPLIGIGEAIEIAGYNNTSVLNTAITRECLDGGRQAGQVLNAINNYNTKCATDVASSARLINGLVLGMARQQIGALAGVLDAMKEAPGLKQMIVLTQGIAGTRDLTSVFEPVITAAAAAGVQIAILTEDDEGVDLSMQNRGITALGQGVGGSSLADRKREDRKMFRAALQGLADMTGGTFESVITNTDGAFRRAALAGSGVYRLGVEAPANSRASQEFVVGAEVARDGVTLRVNRHTTVPGEVPQDKPAARVAAAIKQGTPYYAVPMRVGIARRRASGDQVELQLDIDVPAAVDGPVRVTIGVLDDGGALKQGTRTLSRPDGGANYRYTASVPVAAGAHRVRVAVEDATGGVGSVSTEVDAHLNAMGPVIASDLLTWRKDASGKPQLLALAELPADLTSLNAGLELYAAAGQPVPKDLSVKLSILSASTSTPVAEIDLTPKVDGDIRRVEATLPVAKLAPGAYVLRATVRGDGQRLGEVSTRISIAER
jgi:VWFA-related protein